ncbi:hypothetical protein BH11MYX1_BH11MYX1_32370 [soil metagenome]
MKWCLITLVACAPPAPVSPISLTYLGVAGWQLEADGHVLLTDPYFSRPTDPDAPLVPDAAAIAAHTPAHADLVMVGHSHFDYALDAPAVALRSGAKILGSASTIRLARASGVEADHAIEIHGGEDLEFPGFSVRVIPSLHSMIGMPSTQIAEHPQLPMSQSGYGDGGTFAYLVRIAGREVFVLDTANFIEREVIGVHPDIAILAPGYREKIHAYTCRLIHALGDPPVVLATHFDDWHHAPTDQPPEELADFVAEIHACSPHTRVIVPKHFDRMTL